MCRVQECYGIEQTGGLGVKTFMSGSEKVTKAIKNQDVRVDGKRTEILDPTD